MSCLNVPVVPMDSAELQFSQEPFIITDAIKDWPALKWDISYFASRFPNLQVSFKVSPVVWKTDESKTEVVTENDCVYIFATFQQFLHWLEDECTEGNPFARFPRSHFSCYADYKHINDLFKEDNTVLDAIGWRCLGFNCLTGKDSTIWIGSSGAFTPCHQDTYGYNLIAQIFGKKKWTIFPPSESANLYPTRIPYEESSIFCLSNLKHPGVSRDPKFRSLKRYEVTLSKGDVLYLPKHWWHFVECLEPSISVNTWIKTESDDIDHVNEAIVRLLVFALKRSERADFEVWLNPNEVETSHEENLQFLQTAVAMLQNKSKIDSKESCCPMKVDTNFVINCLSSKKVLTAIREQMILQISDVPIERDKDKGGKDTAEQKQKNTEDAFDASCTQSKKAKVDIVFH